jgi:transcriptional regulator GlxA family with amidase domain
VLKPFSQAPPHLPSVGVTLKPVSTLSEARLKVVRPSATTSRASAEIRARIAILALPKSVLSDLAGPYETFQLAGRIGQERLRLSRPYYDVTLLSVAGSSIATLSGLQVNGACPFDQYKGIPDTLLVAGEADSLDPVTNYVPLFDWVRKVAAQSRRICSICTGIFCLAEAGVLNARKVTTHWQHASSLAQKYPAIEVDPEPLFVRDGKFYTCAGCTAAMDLSLALIQDDLGAEVATEIASASLMYLRRRGRQAQISPLLKLQLSDREPLRDLQSWMLEHLHLPLTVEDLAEQVHMSPRNFSRSFAATVGTTPARFLETLRLEAARRRLEETNGSMDQIASECGFGSAEVMRRSFVRHLGIPPSAYRLQGSIA